MRSHRRIRWLVFFFLLYLTFCVLGGTFLADGALRPARGQLTEQDTARFQQNLKSLHAQLENVSLNAPDDAAELRGWLVRPEHWNGNAALLLHGLGDNRLGMMGYAQLLLAHGFTVLLPDARAHGESGGMFETYGLLERDDIREWVKFLRQRTGTGCVYGMGESMGAAQLLQSLGSGAQFCAIVAESPFANFREIAYDRMGQPFGLGPWVGRTVLRPLVEIAFLRARWKYGFDMSTVSPEQATERTHVPVLLIHGEIDSNIPVRHSRMIHRLAPRTVLWEVPGADHCGAIAAAPEEFEKRVVSWFQSSSAEAQEDQNPHPLSHKTRKKGGAPRFSSFLRWGAPSLSLPVLEGQGGEVDLRTSLELGVTMTRADCRDRETTWPQTALPSLINRSTSDACPGGERSWCGSSALCCST